MLKYITFPGVADDGETLVSTIFSEGASPGLSKTASAQLHPEIKEFIDKLRPDPSKIYILVNALGSGEFYGANLNNDYFREEDLNPNPGASKNGGYRSFLNAGLYKHHANSNPEKSMGKVLIAIYNTLMHRVELVVSIGRARAGELGHSSLVDSLDQGGHPSVSMGCFLPGTGVVTKDFTRKPIEEIEVGDEVLTHTGEVHAVTELHPRDYVGDMYRISPLGKFRESISATREHPWLVMEPEAFYNTSGAKPGRHKDLILSKAVWKTSEELTGDELLVWPRAKRGNSGNHITVEMAKLLGWYLAEGHTHIHDNGVEFSVNVDDQITDEIYYVCSKLKLPAPRVRSHEFSSTSISFTTHDRSLKDACLKYCGKYAHKKRLHEDLFGMSYQATLAFLGAMLSGDGFYSGGQLYISSCNLQLLEQLQWLAGSVHLPSTIGRNNHKAGKGFSTEATVEWTLRFRGVCNVPLAPYCIKVPDLEPRVQSNVYGTGKGTYEYEDFTLVKIEAIDRHHYNGPVYNFEVEFDNSYVVDKWAVHNCKVKYDVCSICGHKSKSLQDRCIHVQNMMGKILPTGEKVFVYNPDPRFFDLSFVVIGAERCSYAMYKVASLIGPVSSVMAAEQAGLLDPDVVKEAALTKSAKKKLSEIIKRIPALSAKVLKRTSYSDSPLPERTLSALSSSPIRRALTTTAASGIILRPDEFQRIALTNMGRSGLARRLQSINIVFAPSREVDRSLPFGNSSEFSSKLRDLLMGSMQRRSIFEPVAARRITMVKVASTTDGVENLTQQEDELLDKIAAAYNGYREHLVGQLPSIVDNITVSDSRIMDSVLDDALDNQFIAGGGKVKSATALSSALLYGLIPLALLYGAYGGTQAREGDKKSFVRKHPLLTASAVVGLSRLAEEGKLQRLAELLIRRIK